VTRALTAYIRTFTGFGRDARRFLVTTAVLGVAMSLYWIDFSLYLKAIGISNSTIALLMATSQVAGVIVAVPASVISNRLGRRTVMVAGAAMGTIGLIAVLPGYLPLTFLGVFAFGAGSATVGAVQIPYIAEHTRAEERNEYFATWQSISFLSSIVGALAGGVIAEVLADRMGITSAAGPYQILLVGTAVFSLVALGTVLWLADDRRSLAAERALEPRRPGRLGSLGLHISNPRFFVKLLLPGFITSLGAGQLIPFLPLFVQGKFSLDLAPLNAIFALANLGTAAAILIQPAIARRFGRIGSIVLVQGASIPFLLVLGFSPVLGTVIIALAVRNSLMNAGSPIFDAFAMSQVSASERALLSALMSLLWALGWIVGPIYYGLLQGTFSFTTAYAIDFVTIIVLYTISTSLLWKWFRRTDSEAQAPASEAGVEPLAADSGAALLEHA
jgi:MFS family permease